MSNSINSSMVEISNNLVKVVDCLFAHVHDEADYCPSCGQNYHSTIGKTCCDDCGSSCNLQGGCGSPDCTNTPEGCEVGDHEYASFNCPSCGHDCCWACSVRCTDDSTGEGHFTCPSCGHLASYPDVKDAPIHIEKAGDDAHIFEVAPGVTFTQIKPCGYGLDRTALDEYKLHWQDKYRDPQSPCFGCLHYSCESCSRDYETWELFD